MIANFLAVTIKYLLNKNQYVLTNISMIYFDFTSRSTFPFAVTTPVLGSMLKIPSGSWSATEGFR